MHLVHGSLLGISQSTEKATIMLNVLYQGWTFEILLPQHFL